MKRCPECRRDYFDDSLSYCLEDGAELIQGSVPSPQDEPATAILHAADITGEAPTRTQIRTSGDADGFPPTTARDARAFDKRLVIVPLLLAAIALGGFLAYRNFNSAGSEHIDSIAVLPFENLGGDPDTVYLSDGLTDSLIFRFSQLPDLKVSPTSSVMRYKGAAAAVSDIAKELDVDAVLTGRLMQLGDNLSISVQLVDARTKKLVWAEQYDRKMSDLLATQREIATTLTQKIKLRLSGDEVGVAKKYTSSSEAYQLYLKGRHHWSRRNKDDLLKAIESYKKAIELDPGFALAYAAMAEAYNSMGKNPDAAPKDSIPLAKAAALRALEIDQQLPQAHSALADAMAIYDWDWKGSEEHFRWAIELDPNISYTRLVHGNSYLVAVSKADEAVKETERAVELEPLSLINNSLLVSAYLNARQNEKALAQARTAFDLDPNFRLVLHWLGLALVANGKSDEAIALSQRVPADSPGGWLSTVVLGHAYAKAGRRQDAEREIAKLRDLAKTRYVRTYYLASIYATLGDKDKALAELERSFEDRDCYLPRAAVDPFMDPLRDDPRFKDLMKRMNLP
jgi:TolB-like protein/Tfp pilus assembly protein PilF